MARRIQTRRAGFTMIELLMAITILAILTVVVGLTFNTVVSTWRRSVETAERVQHADYAMAQVISALRSAYYPTSGSQDNSSGFQLYDGGDDEDAEDSIQWTKLGTAIVGTRSAISETPHAVKLWVEKQERDGLPAGLWAKAGRLDLLPDEDDDFEDFDFGDDEQFPPFVVMPGVQGFNCRVQEKPESEETDGTPKWEDEWPKSNSIPYRVELTLWMQSAEDRGSPVPIRRVVEIPLWDISQNPVSAGADADKNKKDAAATQAQKNGGRAGQAVRGGAVGGGAAGGGMAPGGGAPAGGGGL